MNIRDDRNSGAPMPPELLVAYVDGELSAAQAAEVEARLASDPNAREMVEDLRNSRDLLRAAFGHEEVQEPSGSAGPAALAGAATPRRWGAALAGLATAAAVVLLLALDGIRLPGQVPADIAELHEEVAAYHTVYMTERDHLVEVPAGERSHIEQWLGRRIDGPLQVPDLEAAGFSFAGARLLTLGTLPVAQLMYSADGRLPIAVCVTTAEGAEREAVLDRHHGLGVASWVDDGQTYIVVGALDEGELSGIVELIEPAAAGT